MRVLFSKTSLFIAALALLLAIGIFTGKKPQPNLVQWATKIDDQPPVTVTVTPIEFGKDAAVWKFDIVLDTHSGSLDEDITQVVSLFDDMGNTYRPISWEGPGPGGHHREGVLVFNAVNPVPAYIELKIKHIGGIVERSFAWDIE